jgi:hypothetical protein
MTGYCLLKCGFYLGRHVCGVEVDKLRRISDREPILLKRPGEEYVREASWVRTSALSQNVIVGMNVLNVWKRVECTELSASWASKTDDRASSDV